MRLLADESVDSQIVIRLRVDGHSVVYVAEMSPGISDDEVLRVGAEEGTLLISQDKDFGELVFRQQLTTAGVVLLRLSGLTPERKADIVSAVLREHESEIMGRFTVVSHATLRIRREFG